jgi:predicted Holliday junction resolvase-like endonuclease
MESEIIEHLIPMAGELTVVSVLLAVIYFLVKEIKSLKKRVKEKDIQIKDCINIHLSDMRTNFNTLQAVTEKFDAFANDLKDIIRAK